MSMHPSFRVATEGVEGVWRDCLLFSCFWCVHREHVGKRAASYRSGCEV